MVRRAFEARTDTLSTWGLLQKNCLLLKAEKERSSSALSDRLQHARAARDKRDVQTESQQPSGTKMFVGPKKSVIRRIRPLSKPGRQGTNLNSATQHRDYLDPVSPATARHPLKPLNRPSSSRQPARKGPSFYWLTIRETRRRIALPILGELVLGRFDPNIGVPPDIDLAYEDQDDDLISRQHAKITAKGEGHTIEDLGSRSGIVLNGVRVQSGPSRRLNPGDRIQLGNIHFLYNKIPAHILEAATTPSVLHIFTVTPTGRKLTVSPHNEVIIGRADPQVDFVPTIDLSQDGTVAGRVSRRHALLRWQNGQPYLEDLGSGFGTHLGGEELTLGESTPLKPGDHIWLAGCVVAYDIEM
jgi:pSer/pThr/pTyr-binding forkhead associated (FHA) protein